MKPRQAYVPLLLLSLSSLCGNSASASTLQERVMRRQQGPTPPARTEIAGETEIPMVGDSHWAVVEVRINDQGPYRMILDSGAGVTVLNEDLVLELGLEPQGTTRLGDPSNPEAHEADVLSLATVSLGDAYFDGVAAVGWRGPSLVSTGGIRGILGFPTFAECLLTFDYPARMVEVTQGSLPEPDGRTVLPMSMNGSPSIPILVAGIAFDGHIDTGNMGTIVVPESWMERMPIVAGTERAHTGQRAGSAAESTVAQIEANLQIGTAIIESPQVHFDKTLPVVNLGHGVLKDFRITFDQREGRLRLARPSISTPIGAGAPIDAVEIASPRRIGVQMAMKNGSVFTVADVLAGSAGESAGLKTGDAVLEVDGAPMSQEVLLAALRGSKPVRLTVERDGKRNELTLFEKR